MEIINAIIQGIVQGLTEFLPVSSSGHLAISQHILGVDLEATGFTDVMLHLGTLLAVFIFYHKLILRLIIEFFSMIKDVFTGKFRWREMGHDRSMVVMTIIGLIPLFMLFVPIGNGENIKDIVDRMNGNLFTVGSCLLLTSVLLWLAIRHEKRTQSAKKTAKMNNVRTTYTIGDALRIGVTQFFATMPGLSRSGSTLSVGILGGLDRQKALDYSFILGIPAILAAAAVQTKDVLEEGISVNYIAVAAGTLAAAVVGFFAIKFLKWIVKSDKLSIFAWYTLIAGLATIIYQLTIYN